MVQRAVFNRMKELSKYLEEVLVKNEHVCLPRLGGFISKQVSSHFDPTTHIFTPPHKQIAFNERLSEDGGILVSHLKDALKITAQEAEEKVTLFVNEVRRALESNFEYNIPEIGLLYKNEDGSIGFKPNVSSSLDPLNFGLPQILIKLLLTDK